MVLLNTCFLLGHTTFLSSPEMSLKNRLTLAMKDGFLAVFSFATVNYFLSSLSFSVERVFPAESAVLFHFKSVRIVLFVFHGSVVALFALCAGQHYFDSHCGTSWFLEFLPPSIKGRCFFCKKINPFRGISTIPQREKIVKLFYQIYYIKHK